MASPKKVGPYPVIGEIAHGGMGVVYRVKDPKLGREVALKMMIGGAWSGEDAQRRFLREAHILAELSHPGIVPIHDIGIEDGNPYYTMDLVAGETLGDYVAKHGLSTVQKLRLFIQICEAIQHAHLKGVIHRDLKPANILVDPAGRPVVLDFGLARDSAPGAKASAMTVSGAVMGTPAYMSPEQAQGRVKDIDARTDVYSLGVVLYELVTGEQPFQAGDAYTLMKAVVETDAPPPSTWVRRMPKDLEAVVLKALRKRLDERYASAHALAEDLRRYLSGKAVEAHPDSALYRLRKWAQRHRELSASLAIGGALLLILGTWALLRVVQEGRIAKAEYAKAVEAERRANVETARALEAERKAQAELERAQAAERRALQSLWKAEEEAGRRREAESAREAETQQRERHSQAEGLLSAAERMANLAEALKLCDQALLADPAYPRIHDKRGRLLRALSRPGEALEAFEKALELDPGYVQAHVNRGSVLQAQGLPEPALAALDRAIELDPGYARAYAERAALRVSRGAAAEALKDFDRAVALDPSDLRARLERSRLRRSEGLLPEALEDLDAVLRIQPDRAELHAERGGLLAQQGKLDTAIQAYERALELNPKDVGACISMGQVLLKRGRLVDARKAYERALEVDPRSGETHYQLGLYHLAQKNQDEGLRSLLRAVELDPKHAMAQYRAAQILQKKERFPEALRAYEKAWGLDLPVELQKDCAEQVDALKARAP